MLLCLIVASALASLLGAPCSAASQPGALLAHLTLPAQLGLQSFQIDSSSLLPLFRPAPLLLRGGGAEEGEGGDMKAMDTGEEDSSRGEEEEGSLGLAPDSAGACFGESEASQRSKKKDREASPRSRACAIRGYKTRRGAQRGNAPQLATDWRGTNFSAIIDVRTPAEFTADHVPGAINLPVLNDTERHEVGLRYASSHFDGRECMCVYVRARARPPARVLRLDALGRL
jgi:hypothetical protein